MRVFFVAVLAASTIVVNGCQSDSDLRYLDTSVGERLELPPNLMAPESQSGFELPEVFSGDDASARDKVPVLPNVESLRVEGGENFYWLSINQPVGDIYQHTKNFWASEGYRLTLDEPVIGVMQTEWVLKEVGATKKPGNWLERLLGNDDLSAVQDQFKTRIERDQQGGSRVYIAHRGAEYNYVLDSNERSKPLNDSGDDSDSDWRARQPDPELEIEMLSRLMIYLGLQQAQVDQQLASAKMFKPRAVMQHDTKENSPFLIIKDPYQIAWNRVYHNLERLNFEIVSAEYKQGLIQEVGIIVVNIEVRDSQKKSGLFSRASASESKQRRIVLIVSEENNAITRVEIETEKGEIDTSQEGAEFLSLLHRQIK